MSERRKKTSEDSRAKLPALSIHARPLVKSIADTCRDVGVIAGAIYAVYGLLRGILAALF
jgi:hypothetical protein